MFGDEMRRARMEGASEERAEKQIEQWLNRPSAEFDEEVVESQLDREVQHVDHRPGRAVDEHGPDGVEEDLKGAEKGLSQEGVEEEGFDGRGEVGVETGYAERFVVREVVWL